jgi:hypothetical protein
MQYEGPTSSIAPTWRMVSCALQGSVAADLDATRSPTRWSGQLYNVKDGNHYSGDLIETGPSRRSMRTTSWMKVRKTLSDSLFTRTK